MAIEKKISDLLLSIESREYTIPEFQRGFVWKAEQVKSFFKSLFLGYPTGSFLIWKTKEPSKLRKAEKDSNTIYHHLILDGQQRLTTIYTMFKGKTPSWYEGVSLRTDLYFNLDSKEFEYYIVTKMRDRKEWINISDFLRNGGINKFLEDLETCDDETKSYYLSRLTVLNNLDKIKDYGFYIKEITIPDLDKVVEIFNLVNKTGTTLSESDLALAIITSNWDGVKDKFRDAIEEYKKYNYPFDFNFFTRCLNIITTGRGLFTSALSDVTPEDFEVGWKRLNKILAHLINVLRDNAYIDSLDNLNTPYVLYVLVHYLASNGDKFKSQEEANKAIYWLFVAQLWGRYSGASEAYLEKDISALKQNNSIDELINQMHNYRGASLYLSPNDLALQGTRSRVYNIFYSAIRAQEARDWTNPALPLYSKNVGYNNQLQKHHIFPKAFLAKKYNARNSIHKNMINEIANIAYITLDSNMEIYSTNPAEYLPTINKDELRKQFITTDEKLYTLENYEAFLDDRRKKLTEGINRFLKSFFEDKSETKIPKDLQPYNQQIEIIELAIRDLLANKLNELAEVDPWSELVPQHVRDKVQLTIDKWLSKNPGEDDAQFNEIRNRLNYFDLQEYFVVISAKQLWPEFEDKFGTKEMLQSRFLQLAELRNCIRHSRDVTEVALRDGEAAIAWFSSILRPSPTFVDEPAGQSHSDILNTDSLKDNRKVVDEPWLKDGKLWHFEQKMSEQTKEMFLQLDDLIRSNLDVQPARYTQKNYIAYDSGKFTWLRVRTFPNVIALTISVRRDSINKTEVARELGVQEFDSDDTLSEKLNLPSSINVKNIDGRTDRVILRMKDGFEMAAPAFLNFLKNTLKNFIKAETFEMQDS